MFCPQLMMLGLVCADAELRVAKANNAHIQKTNAHLDRNAERFLTSTLRWLENRLAALVDGSNTTRLNLRYARTHNKTIGYLGDRSCNLPTL
jgi:hypothetical protein